MDASATPAQPHRAPRPARHRPVLGAPAQEAEPETPSLCSLPTFQGAFSSADFVAALSEPELAATRSSHMPLNATPFIETFRKAIEDLQGIRQTVGNEVVALSSDVQVSQFVYAKKMRQLAHNFDATQLSFTSLEGRISEVGRTAIRIGEQLESLNRQRTRASETHDLIEYYYLFARGDTSRLDALRTNGGREGRLKAAMILRRLAVISREVDIRGSADTREAIDRYCEQFEREMLRLFDKHYRRSDPKMMSHVAQVLHTFNGGASCIQIYVNQHDFFISKDRVVEAERIGSSAIWRTVYDPDAMPPKQEPVLDGLFQEIRRTVDLEAQIIAAVFPSPLLVMQTFLQRVFSQSVQGFVESIMNKTKEGHHDADAIALAFLRMLHLTRSHTLLLVSDLKHIDFRSAGITGTSAQGPGSEGLQSILGIGGGDADMIAGEAAAARVLLGDESASAAQLAAAGGSALGAMLDHAVDELFMPYLDSVKYIDRECRLLSSLCATALQRFVHWHKTSIKATRANANIFSRMREQLTGAPTLGSSAAYASLAENAAQQPQQQQQPVSSFLRLVDRARGAVPPQGEYPEEPISSERPGTPQDGESASPSDRGELSLELAERLLRWHAEALGRCVDLSAASDVPKNTFSLLRVLTDAYLKSYVEAVLETATVQMFAYDVRSGSLPDVNTLQLVRLVEQHVKLWSHYVQTAVIPLTAPSVTIRRETTIYDNHNMLRVEGRCEGLIQRFTDNCIAYFNSRLALQKKNDFSPRDDDVTFSKINTDPCLAIVEALGTIESTAREALSEKNRTLLFTELGVGLHALLLEHLKKFVVSPMGGLMLTKDLAMYQDAATRLGVQVVTDRFEMLRQLGNLFIVQPAVIRSYMREGHLAKIGEDLLRPYLLRRQDYAKDVRGLQDEDTSTDANAPNSTPLFAPIAQTYTHQHHEQPFVTDIAEDWTTDLRRDSKSNRRSLTATLVALASGGGGGGDSPKSASSSFLHVQGTSTPRSGTPPVGNASPSPQRGGGSVPALSRS
ncbi:Exocyst complex component 5 [Malassezia cuniculi]|uniref:Exocyst complex component 5 n=1 Tax=Malassezia cuniculi TaxID=948313 RepID=A0AAF0ERU0_9BASI|nr:Exocyst complex component 5 [Malassezia cuniculi]